MLTFRVCWSGYQQSAGNVLCQPGNLIWKPGHILLADIGQQGIDVIDAAGGLMSLAGAGDTAGVQSFV